MQWPRRRQQGSIRRHLSTAVHHGEEIWALIIISEREREREERDQSARKLVATKAIGGKLLG